MGSLKVERLGVTPSRSAHHTGMAYTQSGLYIMVATLDQLQNVAYNAKKHRRSTPRAQIKADTRCRWQVRFWLDVRFDEQYLLAEWVQELKNTRLFAQTARDALALIRDLKLRRVTILEALFPWVVEHYRAQFAAGQGDMNARLAALEAQIASLRTTPAPIGQGPKPMNIPSIPAPVDDDDDDAPVIRKAKGSNGQASENFLKSAFSLIQ
jgi:hypothetical protein